MEILALRGYARGYRGCLIDDDAYVFFQYTRKGRLKRFKSYARRDFESHDHFAAIMMKFMGPSAFLTPPMRIEALTEAELDRVLAEISDSDERV